MQIIIYAILFASAGLSTLAEASAIKGHAHPRPVEEGRSIKLAQVSNNLDKVAAKSAPVQNVAPATPILESSKKIYNDESIRRLAQPQYSSPIVEQVAVAPPVVAPVQQAPVQAPEQKKVEPVVVAEGAAVPVVAKSAPVEPKVDSKVESKVEPKIASVEVPKVEVAKVSEPAQSKPAVEELPAQSERSAQAISADKPAAVNLDQVPSVKQAVEQQSAPVQVQPEVVVPPVVVAQSQPEPVKQQESILQAKKDEVAQSVPIPQAAPVDPIQIEIPAPDPGLVLSEPIDSTTKLLIDLDEHVQKFLPAEDQQQPAQPSKDQVLISGIDYSPASTTSEQAAGKSAPLVPYSSSTDADPIVPPLPSLDGVEKASASVPASASSSSASSSAASSPSATRQGNNQHQNNQQVITQLLDQLDSLQNRIQDTINQLVARRRYVMSALLRPMGTYVRRVRTNLERLQTRVNQLQAAAVSVGGGNGPNRPGGFVDAAAIETIRRRIDDISKRISDIVNRIRFSLTPTSAPMNSNGRK